MRMNRLYLLVMLLCLAVFAVSVAAVYQESDRPWRWYQEEFARRTAADLPDRRAAIPDQAERRELDEAARRVIAEEIALRQIYVPELRQVSRCTSCHTAATEPLAAREEFPWKRHPQPYLEARWHPVEQYGCLVCHGGNGRATDADAAHGEEGLGDTPRRKDEYAQAGCGKCHQANEIEGAPAWNLGRYLAEDRGCSACHDFGEAIARTTIGPDLRALGSKTSRDWLTAWLLRPEAFRVRTRMPRPRLAEAEAATVAQFLVGDHDSTVDALAAQFLVDEPVLGRLARRGRRLAEGEAACATCHDMPRLRRAGRHPVHGQRMTGPDLAKAGEKLKPSYVAALLENPQRLMPGTLMPQFHLSLEQRQALVALVMSFQLRRGGRRQGPDRTEAAPRVSEVDRSLAIMGRLGCLGCHRMAGRDRGGRIGSALADVADRRYWELDWRGAEVPRDERHLTSYLLYRLKGSPQTEGADTDLRMPRFRLSGRDGRGLATYLLSRSAKPLPEKFIVAAPAVESGEINGRFAELDERYRCRTCHQLKGRGGRIGPSLDGVGSKLIGAWLRRHLEQPMVIDATEQARMPRLGIPAEDTETIAAYLVQATGDRRVLGAAARVADLTAAEARAGRAMFYATGSPRRPGVAGRTACVACHRHGDTVGGMVGPSLQNNRRRLAAPWIYTWLRKGHELAAGTRMPTQALSHQEARRATAFVLGDGHRPANGGGETGGGRANE